MIVHVAVVVWRLSPYQFQFFHPWLFRSFLLNLIEHPPKVLLKRLAGPYNLIRAKLKILLNETLHSNRVPSDQTFFINVNFECSLTTRHITHQLTRRTISAFCFGKIALSDTVTMLWRWGYLRWIHHWIYVITRMVGRYCCNSKISGNVLWQCGM